MDSGLADDRYAFLRRVLGDVRVPRLPRSSATSSSGAVVSAAFSATATSSPPPPSSPAEPCPGTRGECERNGHVEVCVRSMARFRHRQAAVTPKQCQRRSIPAAFGSLCPIPCLIIQGPARTKSLPNVNARSEHNLVGCLRCGLQLKEVHRRTAPSRGGMPERQEACELRALCTPMVKALRLPLKFTWRISNA